MPESYKRTVRDIFFIAFRSIVSLSNVVIFAVLGMLFAFHETQAAIFLSLAVLVNVALGLFNDIRARIALERLQLLTTPRFVRLANDDTEESVFAEDLRAGDRVKLVLGDQIPCDSTILSTNNLEISQALTTGESDSFPKQTGEKIFAGDIVVAGSGTIRIDSLFTESRLALMTSGIKKYSVNLSPIQLSVNTAITYSGYLILALIAFLAVRGMFVHEATVDIVKNAAALTSTLIPQGLMVVTTLLFAYGAVRLLREHVLLQDVNATEKLGRIRNLCIDKTGTLTENTPTVERIELPEGVTEKEARELTSAYISGSGDASQTMRAMQTYLAGTSDITVIESTPFTSQRQYGGIRFNDSGRDTIVLVGGPDVFLPFMSEGTHKEWLGSLVDTYTRQGKRLVCVARADGTAIPAHLNDAQLAPVAVFVLENKLRPGTRDIVSFLQARGIRIRVISGDNPETVRSVALSAGITGTDTVITGTEMQTWSTSDYETKASGYTIFARIKPEMKEKIIEALKKNGFTAMVGDGANDALAIKKADLGIAMFDGATATRQLASVVLTNNSFAALPDGVKLADNIIGNIEIMAGLYFYEIFLGFFFFVGVTALGYSYPISPQNMILINYFTVGFPAMITFYWAMRPSDSVRPASDKSFLRKILPFSVWSSAAGAIALTAVFLLSPSALRLGGSNAPSVLMFIALSAVFFMFTPAVYSAGATKAQKYAFFLFAVLECALLYLAFKIPLGIAFFDVASPPLANITEVAAIACVYFFVQYLMAKGFSPKPQSA